MYFTVFSIVFLLSKVGYFCVTKIYLLSCKPSTKNSILRLSSSCRTNVIKTYLVQYLYRKINNDHCCEELDKKIFREAFCSGMKIWNCILVWLLKLTGICTVFFNLKIQNIFRANSLNQWSCIQNFHYLCTPSVYLHPLTLQS